MSAIALLLILGLAAVYAASRSRHVDRWRSAGIGRLLRRFTDLDVRDYASLLRLTGDYAVQELHVQAGDWLADRSLDELRLSDEGVLVLGIRRAPAESANTAALPRSGANSPPTRSRLARGLAVGRPQGLAVPR